MSERFNCSIRDASNRGANQFSAHLHRGYHTFACENSGFVNVALNLNIDHNCTKDIAILDFVTVVAGPLA